MSVVNEVASDVWGSSIWIQSSIAGTPKYSPPVPVFRNAFRLAEKARRATLTITALGLWDAEINGVSVTDTRLNPGWTDYRTRLYYRTFDVTHLLAAGGNELRVLLGDGWFAGRVAHMDRGFYGETPRLRFHLEIELESGARVTVDSGSATEWSLSKILRSDLLDGETYDARRVPDEWKPAVIAEDYAGICALHPGEPVVVSEELVPITGPTPVKSSWGQKAFVYDFGQNFAGIVRFSGKGQRGVTIKLRYAEMLNPDGTLYTANLRSAAVTDYYTFAGDEWETFEPKFTFHGFRYVEISIHEDAIAKCEPFDSETVRGLVLHTRVEKNSSFECDHPLLNQLWRNIDWGLRSNFLEIPTDCPQRDERLGWTGDIQVFARTALIQRRATQFLHKWLIDLCDSQAEDGSIPMVAPSIATPPIPTSDGGAGWADAMVVVPFEMEAANGYQVTDRHRVAMWKWFEYLKSTSKDGVRAYEGCGFFLGFGDWVALDDPSQPYHGGTPRDLIATAYFARACNLVAHFWSHDPKKLQEAKEWEYEARKAFIREFWEEGRLKQETQTGYLLALNFILDRTDPRYIQAAAGLVRKIEENNFKLNTGFLGTPLLCETLVWIEREDLAMKILLNEEYPGWFFSIKNGATTTWERWNSFTEEGFGDVNMNSFNHYAYGSIGAFIMEYVAGIRIDRSVKPVIGHGINQVQASRTFLLGQSITVDWKLRDEAVDFRIEVLGLDHVPFECSGVRKSLTAGVSAFSVPR
jgi:alpha-L-rhamnosidase